MGTSNGKRKAGSHHRGIISVRQNLAASGIGSRVGVQPTTDVDGFECRG